MPSCRTDRLHREYVIDLQEARDNLGLSYELAQIGFSLCVWLPAKGEAFTEASSMLLFMFESLEVLISLKLLRMFVASSTC